MNHETITNLLLMGDPMRRLLGISRETASKMDIKNIYFAAGWPVRSVVIFLAVATLWFGALYLMDGRRPSLWVKIPLLLLRLMALCALGAMLLQPMLRMHHSDVVKPSVLLLVDNSLSMGFRDPRLPADRAAQVERATGLDGRSVTRAKVVEKLINDSKRPLIPYLIAHNYNVHLYRFSSEPLTVSIPVKASQLKSWQFEDTPDPIRGNSTQIGTALQKALDDVAGQPVAGALILSDGGNNLGDDPVSLAQRAHEQGVKLSDLGVGDPTPTRDIAITEALADQVVRKNSQVQVFVGVSQRGYQGKTITLTLRRGGQVIGAKALVLGPPSRKQTVAFTYTPKQDGVYTYTVSTPVQPKEITGDNNHRSFMQKVTSKKLKILYVENEPRWEYRYLKNAILRDKEISFSCLMTAPNSPPGGEGNVPIYRFPQDEKSLFDYDILILGDVPRSYFSALQLENIRHFVEDKGSSLIVICGQQHMPQEYRGTPLEAIFPVTLPSTPQQVITDEPFQWELTAAGRQDPLLKMSDDPAENQRIWAAMPGMYWCAGVNRAKPGATVLAVNSLRSNAYGKDILLAVQSFGAGRCLMTTTDGCWRWRWKVGDRYFYRYWGQAIRAMTPNETPGGNRYTQINPDRSEYLLGDRVSIHARLLDTFYRPVKDRTVSARLTSDAGVTSSIVMSAIPGSPGLFSADFLADRIGKFQISVASPASPAARASAPFLVQSIALEKQQPEMNEDLLKKMAMAGGGIYLHPDELKDWTDGLKKNVQLIRSETEVELWDAPILLILFIIPLTIEWLVRKRSGML
jgi:hypothetical protein